ncbi:MAG: hypothetical protein EA358_08265 [Flavobacteriales bacterium]|nr:MAG: hypothetical protein EA358_08265 [Flavobacteriales bacterium]
MNKAVIDLGTNTFNLLIADADTHAILVNQKMPVHLGRGGLKERRLTEESMLRGLDVLRLYKGICADHQVDEIRAVACSAVRSAENKQVFVDLVKSELDIHVEVLSGEVEAEYIYRGIHHAVKIDSDTLIMDIGGGSTELIMCDSQSVQWLASYDFGVSRLLEVYGPSDPLSAEDIERIRVDIERSWRVIERRDIPRVLVGSSGSFDTLAGLYLKQQGGGYNGLEIPLDSIRGICGDLLRSTEVERREMPGMDLSRTPHIHLSALLVLVILDLFSIERVVLSQFALKEGVLFASLSLG